jgi:hypothetical protein
LDKLKIDSDLMHIIREYVEIPDTENKGVGIVAGGVLSMLYSWRIKLLCYI